MKHVYAIIIKDSWKGKLKAKEIKEMCIASLNRLMNELC